MLEKLFQTCVPFGMIWAWLTPRSDANVLSNQTLHSDQVSAMVGGLFRSCNGAKSWFEVKRHKQSALQDPLHYSLWNVAVRFRKIGHDRRIQVDRQVIGDQEPLESRIKYLVSIGAGVPSLISGWHLLYLQVARYDHHRDRQIAERFRRDSHTSMTVAGGIGLKLIASSKEIEFKESKKREEIAKATQQYIKSQDVFKQMQACVDRPASARQFSTA